VIKSILKALLPHTFLHYWRRRKVRALRERYAPLTVRDAFSRIYHENQWGGTRGKYCSGSGSSGRAADLYCDYVRHFVEERQINSIVDLGCGDFQIGGRIAPLVGKYVGVDVVPDLIALNRRMFRSQNVAFECLDITTAPLPSGELCLVRQVLQHLSNDQIQAILPKLNAFPCVLITEHQMPKATFRPNKDKPHGPDTRLEDESSVVLDAPPFSLNGTTAVLVVPVDLPLVCAGESITTFLWCPAGQARNSWAHR
jgi:SAM-dependent methyltransferase